MKELIKNISDSDLILMCNEIYEWKKAGLLNQEGLVKKLFSSNEKELPSLRYLEEEILFESYKRFQNVVKLLFTHNPSLYIKP